MVIAGHRGAPAYEPENTMRSFKTALDQGAEMIELDIYRCATGELMVIHDDRVNRTTDGDGLVELMSYRELRRLNAGKGEKIPTLDEVCELLLGSVPINIELKGRETAEALSRFLDDPDLKRRLKPEDLLVSSFDLPELMKFREMKPSIRRGALNGGIPLNLGEFAEPLEPWSIHYSLEFINQKMVDDAHERGCKVFIYTVDRKDDLELLKSWGVDYVFSNCPGDLR